MLSRQGLQVLRVAPAGGELGFELLQRQGHGLHLGQALAPVLAVHLLALLDLGQALLGLAVGVLGVVLGHDGGLVLGLQLLPA